MLHIYRKLTNHVSKNRCSYCTTSCLLSVCCYGFFSRYPSGNRYTKDGVVGGLARYVLGPHTKEQFEAQGVIFLEVFELLKERWQDHVAQVVNASETHGEYDCIHWLIPG